MRATLSFCPLLNELKGKCLWIIYNHRCTIAVRYGIVSEIRPSLTVLIKPFPIYANIILIEHAKQRLQIGDQRLGVKCVYCSPWLPGKINALYSLSGMNVIIIRFVQEAWWIEELCSSAYKRQIQINVINILTNQLEVWWRFWNQKPIACEQTNFGLWPTTVEQQF